MKAEIMAIPETTRAPAGLQLGRMGSFFKVIRHVVPLIFDIIYQDSHSADNFVPGSNPAHNPSPPSCATSPPRGTGRIVIERGRLQVIHRYRNPGDAAVAGAEVE